MRCRFCFATFQEMRKTILPAGHLAEQEALDVVEKLADAGFRKINFAGGEPFLAPWLGRLVKHAKGLGMTTSVVTNGSYFDRAEDLAVLESLDWLALSVDSVVPDTLRQLGRVKAHQPIAEDRYLEICRAVHAAGVKLKINTVVTSVNRDERLDGFIRAARPLRWKVMQVLPVDSPDTRIDAGLLISDRQFKKFVRNNRKAWRGGVRVVGETNKDMIGSYVMVDPAGRFYTNVDGTYRYSDPILQMTDIHGELAKLGISRRRFALRGGMYLHQPADMPVAVRRIRAGAASITGLATLVGLLRLVRSGWRM
jgi:radical S-adenosyl methionine domain-containing protein 2